MGKFRVYITTEVIIEVSDDILALHRDAEWVHDFYGLDTPEKIAEHLAYNVGLHNHSVASLDGFADRADTDVNAQIVWTDYETERTE